MPGSELYVHFFGGFTLPQTNTYFTDANSIMRLNTLHAVYTPEHAVCRGGHFLATSTMQDTFSALVHTFVCAATITNEIYHESRFILTKMIMFYHTAFVKQALISGQLSVI